VDPESISALTMAATVWESQWLPKEYRSLKRRLN
jgi:hypothetical protein